MMTVKGLMLPCVNDVLEANGTQWLSRFPNLLNESIGNSISHNMYSQEIRLIPDERVTIELEIGENLPENKCEIYYGDFGPAHEIHLEGRTTINIEPFSMCDTPFEKLPAGLTGGSFDPRVVRVILLCKSVGIRKVSGSFHLPEKAQLPSKKMLVYGTSISQGTSTHIASGAYPWIIGRELGIDVENYSLAGCCLLENETIDFLSHRQENYGLILLEPSTNLFAQGFSVKEFKIRCKKLLHTMLEAYPKAEIICIDLFASLFDFGFTGKFSPQASCDEYRDALAEVVNDFTCAKLHFAKSQDIFEPRNLSADLLHPTTAGYFQIASGLIKYISENSLV